MAIHSDTDWLGIHPQDDLLQIHNPPAGWLQDCDALPGQHTTPDPFTPDRYQTYIINTPKNESPRALRMRALLPASSRITLSEAIAFSQDTYIIHSEQWIRALNIALAGQNRSGLVQTLIDAFSETVVHLQTAYNRLNITHKEIQRFRQNDHSWPLASSSGPGITALRAVHTISNQHIHDGISGQSCTTIVSFHLSKGVTSHSVVPYGQSDTPSSPHHTDQAKRLFSRERLKPTHFCISPKQLKLQHTLQMP